MAVEQLSLTYSGGSFLTNSRRAVWHTTEGGSIDGAVSAYRSQGFCPHFTWDSVTGRIVQHLPLDEAASTLVHHGDPQTNRWGAIQIEVVGFAIHPFTAGPCAGLSELVGILRAQGVPDVWPLGHPLPYPQSYGQNNGNRDATKWRDVAGHYTHSQIIENDHGDPGAIDPDVILGTTTPPKELPSMFLTATSNGTGYLVLDTGAKQVANGTDYVNLRDKGHVTEVKLSDETIKTLVTVAR